MKNKKEYVLRDFYVLWSTQSLSQLGSSITAFALTLLGVVGSILCIATGSRLKKYHYSEN